MKNKYKQFFRQFLLAARQSLSFGVLFLACTTAYAQWVLVGGGGELEFYWNPESKKKDGDISRMWLLINYDKPQQNEGKIYSSDVLLMQFNCKLRTYRFSAISYSEQMAKGNSVDNMKSSDEWANIPTNGMFPSSFTYACL